MDGQAGGRFLGGFFPPRGEHHRMAPLEGFQTRSAGGPSGSENQDNATLGEARILEGIQGSRPVRLKALLAWRAQPCISGRCRR